MNKKLILFFLTHFTYGMMFSMFGPIIPYLAEASNRIESDFTFMFVMRGISYLIAGFCQQSFFKQYCLYKRMLVSCILSGISLIFFQLFYSYHFVASLICLILFLANGSMEVLINVLLMTSSNGEAKKAISFSYGFYGVGGVAGSMIVGIMGINALTFTSIWITAVGFLYFDLIEFRKKDKEEINQQMIESVQINVDKPKQVIFLKPQIEMNFSILFCIYAAISLSYRSWLPSFIVMQKISTKQMAAISVSIYSAVLTIFRFVFMFWNPDVVKSLVHASQILIVTLLGSILSYMVGFQYTLIFGSSIILGIIFSSYVPYVYALPSEYGMSFTEKGTCNTIISYAIGEAVISAVIGCLMEWIHPIMLFATMFLFSILNRHYILVIVGGLEEEREKEKNKEMF